MPTEETCDTSPFLLGAASALAFAAAANAQAITIATVNNGDMIRMQGLTTEFNKAHPDITVNWVTLEENILRERVTTDIATGGGQYDIMTIGNYEVPIWGKQGWLTPLEFDADYDVDDLLPAIRGGLTVDGKLYAAPFYGESAMIMYRTDLFEKAGLTMPESPTWEFIGDAARKITDRAADINGICLRGKAGWGENMALIARLRSTTRSAARWFDEKWTPQFDQPEWKAALQFYADLMKDAGPAGRLVERLQREPDAVPAGQVRDVDRRHRRRRPSSPTRRARPSPTRSASRIFPNKEGVDNHGNWLWSWNLAIPTSSKNADAAKTFIDVGDLQGLYRARRRQGGLGHRASGHPHLALREPELPGRRRPSPARRSAAMNAADITKPTVAAGALHRRPVRRDPGVPVDRHHGRPALLGGDRRPVERRRRARPGPVGHRARDEARRILERSSQRN